MNTKTNIGINLNIQDLEDAMMAHTKSWKNFPSNVKSYQAALKYQSHLNIFRPLHITIDDDFLSRPLKSRAVLRYDVLSLIDFLNYYDVFDRDALQDWVTKNVKVSKLESYDL